MNTTEIKKPFKMNFHSYKGRIAITTRDFTSLQTQLIKTVAESANIKEEDKHLIKAALYLTIRAMEEFYSREPYLAFGKENRPKDEFEITDDWLVSNLKELIWVENQKHALA